MTIRYYFLVADAADEARPLPEIALTDAGGHPVDVWHFFRGEPYTGGPVPVAIGPADKQYHLLYDEIMVPLVSRRLADLFRESADGDVQLVPTTHPDYSVLNVLRVLDAIDQTRSSFTPYPGDYYRADLAGKPMVFSKLVLSPGKISASVCRLVGWEMAVVVSGRVRDHITAAAVPGVVFSPVQVGAREEAQAG